MISNLLEIIDKSGNKNLIICGATATGKSDIAIELAMMCDALILNADSMQVYRELPILTAQPRGLEDKHRLYGIISCREEFSVSDWLRLIKNEIIISGKRLIIVGGSGMYIKALIHGIAQTPDISNETKLFVDDFAKSSNNLHKNLIDVDETLSLKIHPNDTKRIKRALMVYYETKIPLSQWHAMAHSEVVGKFFVINRNIDRALIYDRCDKRFLNMLEEGALDEVRDAVRVGYSKTAAQILGFNELVKYISGNLSIADATALAQQKIRNYAKRQLTWFRHQFIYDMVIGE